MVILGISALVIVYWQTSLKFKNLMYCPSLEAQWVLSQSGNFSHFMELMFHYIHKSWQLVPLLSLMNLVHTLSFCFLRPICYWILSSTFRVLYHYFLHLTVVYNIFDIPTIFPPHFMSLCPDAIIPSLFSIVLKCYVQYWIYTFIMCLLF